MTTKRPDYQPCKLVSLCGQFLTPNGTFSADPASAHTAERFWMERLQRRINTATIIVRA